MESVKKQKQLSPSFHAPLEISPKARDSHIPTARRRPGWKSGKPQAGFPLSHAGLATTATVYVCRTKNQSKKIGRFAASSSAPRDHVALAMRIEIKKSLAAVVTDAVQQAQSWPRPVGRF